jgi:hypothetical protein
MSMDPEPRSCQILPVAHHFRRNEVKKTPTRHAVILHIRPWKPGKCLVLEERARYEYDAVCESGMSQSVAKSPFVQLYPRI